MDEDAPRRTRLDVRELRAGVADAGALVGLVAAIGTASTWVIAQSWTTVLAVALPSSGGLWLVGVAFVVHRARAAGATAQARDNAFWAVFLTAFVAVAWAVVCMGVHVRLWTFAYSLLCAFAAVAISAGLFGGPELVANWRRTQKRSRKPCPDCAETVSAAAHKCRYCGFRFSPVPASPQTANSCKPCPDCAETVSAAAHKCRYCGYRFSAMPTLPRTEDEFVESR